MIDKTLAILSTKGGVGKSTTAANIGALLADAGKRVLLIDLDIQPTLSSYFPLIKEAPAGIFELLAQGQTCAEDVISKTNIPNLDVIVSNDQRDLLPTLLLNAADGRLRLRGLLSKIDADYDIAIIDTRGTQSVVVEIALLAANRALSPVMAEMLVAREFRRGTLQLLRELETFRQIGIEFPIIQAFINKCDYTADSRIITDHLRDTFRDEDRVQILDTPVFANVAFRKAATTGMPAHRYESVRPKGRKMAAALDNMKSLASEVFPEWRTEIENVGNSPFETAEVGGDK